VSGAHGLVIAFGGPHGAGKSTCAKAVAHTFKLKYVSAGDLFRKAARKKHMPLTKFNKLCSRTKLYDRMINEETRRQAAIGGVVIDSQLGPWLIKDLADVKVLVTASADTRYARLASRGSASPLQQKAETVSQEKLQRERFKKKYGIDIEKTDIYNIKIDSAGQTTSETIKMVTAAIKNHLSKMEASQFS